MRPVTYFGGVRPPVLNPLQHEARLVLIGQAAARGRAALRLPTGFGRLPVAIATAWALHDSGRRVLYVTDRTTALRAFAQALIRAGATSLPDRGGPALGAAVLGCLPGLLAEVRRGQTGTFDALVLDNGRELAVAVADGAFAGI